MSDLEDENNKNNKNQENEDVDKKWSPQQEEILKQWAEISKSYRWLHDRSYGKFKWQNFWFSIPVIVLSNLTGIANFAQNSIPDEVEYKKYVPLGIGFINILAGIITTIYQFLKVAELVEGHRAASLSYSKFSRDITVQLALPYNERKYHGKDFLTMKKDEFDGLLEKGPTIPNNIVQEYAEEFMTKNKCANGNDKSSKKSSRCFCCWCCRKRATPVNLSPKKCTLKRDCDCNKCTEIAKPELVQIHPVLVYKPTTDDKVEVLVDNIIRKRNVKKDEQTLNEITDMIPTFRDYLTKDEIDKLERERDYAKPIAQAKHIQNDQQVLRRQTEDRYSPQVYREKEHEGEGEQEIYDHGEQDGELENDDIDSDIDQDNEEEENNIEESNSHENNSEENVEQIVKNLVEIADNNAKKQSKLPTEPDDSD